MTTKRKQAHTLSHKHTHLAITLTLLLPLLIPLSSTTHAETLPPSQNSSGTDLIEQRQLRNQSQQLIEQQQQQIIADSETQQPITKDSTETVKTTNTQTAPQQISPETAIFIAINQQNWTTLKQMIEQYQTLDNANPDILLFANAALNAANGNISTAISQYQQLLVNQPDFVRARLELARLYYQDQLLNQAKAEFEQLQQTQNMPPSVLNNINAYLTAINNRQRINGTVAVTLGYDDNIKDAPTSDASHCFIYAPDGTCLTSASATEKPIKDSSFGYEISLNKNWQLQGHHGMTANVLSYGRAYRDNKNKDNNSATINASIGYRFSDHNSELTFTPVIENHREMQQKLYDAQGVRLSIRQTLPKTWASKFITSANAPVWSLDLEQTHYRYENDYKSNDGKQRSAFTSFVVPTKKNQWVLLGEYIDRDNQFTANAYTQKGWGVANSHQWDNGIQTTLIARQRWRNYDGYNALLQAQREDKQTVLSANMRIPKLAWHGFEPSINYQYRKNDSNIDWLYDYDSSEVTFKLQKVF
ncbi:porin family protein [Psychrobacter sp. I-STPA10]|uniref:porin family protein n=1 Tax=Psychrobacter sp. I-STPA10 TaxID=2585769 RepID=UPI001E553632|nr:porin family protein [Psychrobacter sp. I-STPA10]